MLVYNKKIIPLSWSPRAFRKIFILLACNSIVWLFTSCHLELYLIMILSDQFYIGSINSLYQKYITIVFPLSTVRNARKKRDRIWKRNLFVIPPLLISCFPISRRKYNKKNIYMCYGLTIISIFAFTRSYKVF